MHLLTTLPLYLFPLITATTTLAYQPHDNPRPIPRSLSAILIEPPQADPNPHLQRIDLPPTPTPTPTPHLAHLDLRAAAAPAAPAAAAPVAPAAAAPVPGAPAAPAAVAPVAPVPGVGGGAGAPLPQPATGATAEPVTTIEVVTVINGVTTTTKSVFTQTFGPAASPPPVGKGSIGLGTLTGEVGVVKTGGAKSGGVGVGVGKGGGVGWEVVGVVGGWVVVMGVGGVGVWGWF